MPLRCLHIFGSAHRRALPFLLMLLVGAFPSVTPAQSVFFINPGKTDEAFWRTSNRSMEAAARSLGMSFDSVYTERQQTKVIETARRLAALPASQQPDYVIIANERGVAPEVIRLFEGGKSKLMLAYSGIRLPADIKAHGLPREKYRHWIGSIEPRAEDAGYLTAKALIEKARQMRMQAEDGKLHLIAISGDRSTTTSILRSQGMQRAVAEARDVVMDQEVFAQFDLDEAADKAGILFKRFPGARLVWAASDQMAFGAMKALEARGGSPGRDVLFSGINTSAMALGMLKEGRLSALAGGHFIAGAWALVLIHDYHRGKDFAEQEGTTIDANMFVNFSAKDAEQFIARFARDEFDAVNFRQFSKVLNPRVTRYNFLFDQWIR